MKIAVASSGLGHVARGIESWALSLADALTDRERYPDLEVTLFAAAPVKTLARLRVVPCLQRGDRAAIWLARWTPGFAWRWGLKSVYGWEQFSFWLRLSGSLRRERYDILHVQDPMLAYWCRAWRRRGWLATREILAHGTEEPRKFIEQFDCVQHLAPWHKEAPGVDGNRPRKTCVLADG